MNDSRRIIVDDGMNYIFWGVVASAGLFITYFLITAHLYDYIKWIWIVLIAAGWYYSVSKNIKREKRRNVKTFAGRILSVTWLSCGISMTTIGLIGSFSEAIPGVYISPTIGIILGIAYALTGTVYNNKGITSISVAWWFAGIFMFLWPGLHTILIMAMMLIFFQIIPGYLLYLKYKKEIALQ